MGTDVLDRMIERDLALSSGFTSDTRETVSVGVGKDAEDDESNCMVVDGWSDYSSECIHDEHKPSVSVGSPTRLVSVETQATDSVSWLATDTLSTSGFTDQSTVDQSTRSPLEMTREKVVSSGLCEDESNVVGQLREELTSCYEQIVKLSRSVEESDASLMDVRRLLTVKESEVADLREEKRHLRDEVNELRETVEAERRDLDIMRANMDLLESSNVVSDIRSRRVLLSDKLGFCLNADVASAHSIFLHDELSDLKQKFSRISMSLAFATDFVDLCMKLLSVFVNLLLDFSRFSNTNFDRIFCADFIDLLSDIVSFLKSSNFVDGFGDYSNSLTYFSNLHELLLSGCLSSCSLCKIQDVCHHSFICILCIRCISSIQHPDVYNDMLKAQYPHINPMNGTDDDYDDHNHDVNASGDLLSDHHSNTIYPQFISQQSISNKTQQIDLEHQLLIAKSEINRLSHLLYNIRLNRHHEQEEVKEKEEKEKEIQKKFNNDTQLEIEKIYFENLYLTKQNNQLIIINNQLYHKILNEITKELNIFQLLVNNNNNKSISNEESIECNQYFKFIDYLLNNRKELIKEIIDYKNNYNIIYQLLIEGLYLNKINELKQTTNQYCYWKKVENIIHSNNDLITRSSSIENEFNVLVPPPLSSSSSPPPPPQQQQQEKYEFNNSILQTGHCLLNKINKIITKIEKIEMDLNNLKCIQQQLIDLKKINNQWKINMNIILNDLLILRNKINNDHDIATATTTTTTTPRDILSMTCNHLNDDYSINILNPNEIMPIFNILIKDFQTYINRISIIENQYNLLNDKLNQLNKECNKLHIEMIQLQSSINNQTIIIDNIVTNNLVTMSTESINISNDNDTENLSINLEIENIMEKIKLYTNQLNSIRKQMIQQIEQKNTEQIKTLDDDDQDNTNVENEVKEEIYVSNQYILDKEIFLNEKSKTIECIDNKHQKDTLVIDSTDEVISLLTKVPIPPDVHLLSDEKQPDSSFDVSRIVEEDFNVTEQSLLDIRRDYSTGELKDASVIDSTDEVISLLTKVPIPPDVHLLSDEKQSDSSFDVSGIVEEDFNVNVTEQSLLDIRRDYSTNELKDTSVIDSTDEVISLLTKVPIKIDQKQSHRSSDVSRIVEEQSLLDVRKDYSNELKNSPVIDSTDEVILLLTKVPIPPDVHLLSDEKQPDSSFDVSRIVEEDFNVTEQSLLDIRRDYSTGELKDASVIDSTDEVISLLTKVPIPPDVHLLSDEKQSDSSFDVSGIVEEDFNVNVTEQSLLDIRRDYSTNELKDTSVIDSTDEVISLLTKVPIKIDQKQSHRSSDVSRIVEEQSLLDVRKDYSNELKNSPVIDSTDEVILLLTKVPIPPDVHSLSDEKQSHSSFDVSGIVEEDFNVNVTEQSLLDIRRDYSTNELKDTSVIDSTDEVISLLTKVPIKIDQKQSHRSSDVSRIVEEQSLLDVRKDYSNELKNSPVIDSTDEVILLLTKVPIPPDVHLLSDEKQPDSSFDVSRIVEEDFNVTEQSLLDIRRDYSTGELKDASVIDSTDEVISLLTKVPIPPDVHLLSDEKQSDSSFDVSGIVEEDFNVNVTEQSLLDIRRDYSTNELKDTSVIDSTDEVISLLTKVPIKIDQKQSHRSSDVSRIVEEQSLLDVRKDYSNELKNSPVIDSTDEVILLLTKVPIPPDVHSLSDEKQSHSSFDVSGIVEEDFNVNVTEQSLLDIRRDYSTNELKDTSVIDSTDEVISLLTKVPIKIDQKQSHRSSDVSRIVEEQSLLDVRKDYSNELKNSPVIDSTDEVILLLTKVPIPPDVHLLSDEKQPDSSFDVSRIVEEDFNVTEQSLLDIRRDYSTGELKDASVIDSTDEVISLLTKVPIKIDQKQSHRSSDVSRIVEEQSLLDVRKDYSNELKNSPVIDSTDEVILLLTKVPIPPDVHLLSDEKQPDSSFDVSRIVEEDFNVNVTEQSLLDIRRDYSTNELKDTSVIDSTDEVISLLTKVPIKIDQKQSHRSSDVSRIVEEQSLLDVRKDYSNELKNSPVIDSTDEVILLLTKVPIPPDVHLLSDEKQSDSSFDVSGIVEEDFNVNVTEQSLLDIRRDYSTNELKDTSVIDSTDEVISLLTKVPIKIDQKQSHRSSDVSRIVEEQSLLDVRKDYSNELKNSPVIDSTDEVILLLTKVPIPPDVHSLSDEKQSHSSFDVSGIVEEDFNVNVTEQSLLDIRRDYSTNELKDTSVIDSIDEVISFSTKVPITNDVDFISDEKQSHDSSNVNRIHDKEQFQTIISNNYTKSTNNTDQYSLEFVLRLLHLRDTELLYIISTNNKSEDEELINHNKYNLSPSILNNQFLIKKLNKFIYWENIDPIDINSIPIHRININMFESQESIEQQIDRISSTSKNQLFINVETIEMTNQSTDQISYHEDMDWYEQHLYTLVQNALNALNQMNQHFLESKKPLLSERRQEELINILTKLLTTIPINNSIQQQTHEKSVQKSLQSSLSFSPCLTSSLLEEHPVCSTSVVSITTTTTSGVTCFIQTLSSITPTNTTTTTTSFSQSKQISEISDSSNLSFTTNLTYPRRSEKASINELISSVDHLRNLHELRSLAKYLLDQYHIVTSELDLQSDTNWCLRQRLTNANSQLNRLTGLLNKSSQGLSSIEEDLSLGTDKTSLRSEHYDGIRHKSLQPTYTLNNLQEKNTTSGRRLNFIPSSDEQLIRSSYSSSIQTMGNKSILKSKSKSKSEISSMTSRISDPDYFITHGMFIPMRIMQSISSQTVKHKKVSCLPRNTFNCGPILKRSHKHHHSSSIDDTYQSLSKPCSHDISDKSIEIIDRTITSTPLLTTTLTNSSKQLDIKNNPNILISNWNELETSQQKLPNISMSMIKDYEHYPNKSSSLSVSSTMNNENDIICNEKQSLLHEYNNNNDSSSIHQSPQSSTTTRTPAAAAAAAVTTTITTTTTRSRSSSSTSSSFSFTSFHSHPYSNERIPIKSRKMKFHSRFLNLFKSNFKK
ncbi:unnamed protein product [Schistosoma guineensis]|nr:unnamed protein product [Schistosoma guineensis]